MKITTYIGMALVFSFFSVLEVKADNPFSNFKPYEQDNIEQPTSETAQSAKGEEHSLEDGSHLEKHEYPE